MVPDFIQRLAAFGCLGLLVEIFFTGTHSLLTGNKSAVGKTYLWMFGVWGVGGTVLEFLRDGLPNAPHWWAVPLRALIYLLAIYLMEFSWGWFFEKLLGRCPWKYTDPVSQEKIHKFSLMGFIRLDYAIYWLMLAMMFDVYGGKIRLVINAISRL